MTKRTRKQYTDEYRAGAVKLVTEEGYSIAEAARNLGLNANMLGRWKRELSDHEDQRQLAVNEKAELKRLREEIRRLKMEREILKNRSRATTAHRTETRAPLHWRSARTMTVSLLVI